MDDSERLESTHADLRDVRTDFVILLGGDCAPSERLLKAVRGRRAIAADGGMRHAASLGLEPELWVGDFDSAATSLRERYADTPRETHPVAKDATDGEIATRAALRRGATRILYAGAFGGPRLDHALGTLMLGAATAARSRIGVALTDGRQWGYPLLPDAELRLVAREGATLSVVGLEDLVGLTIEGAAWPLDARNVPFGASLTLSNAVGRSGEVRLRLARGRAIALIEP